MNKKNTNEALKYNNIERTNKSFMYQNLKRSNCYNCDFTGSNFNYVSFRGAHFKSCDFYGCTFKESEFIGSNLKKSGFKNAKFDNAIFEGVNLDEVDFKGAKFKNTVFLGTDISKAKNLKINNDEMRFFNEMPEVEISEELRETLEAALENKYIKSSRVLDTKTGEINNLIVMLLLEKFNEKTLINGLQRFIGEIGKDFSTLSYVTRMIDSYKEKGLL